MALSKELIQFANGNTDLYVAFADYHKNREKANHEDKETLNKAYFAEVERVSGVSRDGLATNAWMSNPSVRWANFAVVDGIVNAILPDVLSQAFGLFMDLRFVDVGDILKFKVEPRSLYTVSSGAGGSRTTLRQKHFAGDVILAPKEHLITVFVDMYRVFAEKDDIADAVNKVVLTIEQAMYKDAFAALSAGLDGLATDTYKITGAFAPKKLVTLCERVQAYNYGVRPIIAGVASALMKVLPDQAVGYRGIFDANRGAVDIMTKFYGYDVVMFDQAASGNDGLLIPENNIYVVSPSQDKLVKGAVSAAMNNSNDYYDNADLTQNFTMRKNWDFQFASAARAGIYTVNAE